MTVTVDLPDALAETFLALPAEKRNHLASDAPYDALVEEGVLEDGDEDILPALPIALRLEDIPERDRAAVLAGLADSEAGRVMEVSVLFANLDQHLKNVKATRRK